MATETMTMRRRREIEFLARELFGQAQGLLTAVGDLVPAELASGDGELAEGTSLRAVTDQLDNALLCFNLLQQELGLPAGAAPRYERLMDEVPGTIRAVSEERGLTPSTAPFFFLSPGLEKGV